VRDRRIGLRRTRPDAYRVYAILVIVWAHCEAALDRPTGWYLQVGYLLSVVGHTAVPFFLFIAGNHLGGRIARRPDFETVAPYLARLLRLFLVWSAIYFVHHALALDKAPSLASFGRHARRLLADPVGLVLHGASEHLWFLPALAFAALGAALVLRWARLRTLLVITAVLYGLALVAGPYGLTQHAEVPRLTEARLLQTPLFFALGVVLSLRRALLPRHVGWLLIGVGLTMQGLEIFVFERAGLDPFRLGMLVGTVPLTVGIGVLALLSGGTWLDRRAARVAGLVPVVYLSHILFMDLLRPYRYGADDIPMRIGFTVVVMLVSFAAAWGLRAIGRRWPLVSRMTIGARSGALA
jgi:surface polysaccharide O-acyltransferase-like enzyme